MKDSCPICKEQKDARAKLCSLCYNKSRDGSKEKTIASKRKWRENNREKANIAIRNGLYSRFLLAPIFNYHLN